MLKLEEVPSLFFNYPGLVESHQICQLSQDTKVQCSTFRGVLTTIMLLRQPRRIALLKSGKSLKEVLHGKLQ
jgi:hypothetical protein